MIKKTLLLLLIMSSVYAETETSTSFGNEQSMGTDIHGSPLFNRTVTIKTDDYKVENFWNKLSFSGSGQDEMKFNSISKSGTVRITVESTSLCTLYPELDKNGCSGQKPFLINNEAVPAYDATVSLIFKKTAILSDYSNTNADAFYPLDVDRNEKFYKSQSDNTTSFFGFFRKLFSFFFGTGTQAPTGNTQTEDIRQRYMANIVSGIDQDHLLEKNVTVIEPVISTPTVNNPVALLDYTVTTTTPGSCRLGFFRFPAGSIFCNFPFFSKNIPQTTVTTDTISEDTESSLIAFAGTFIGENINDYNTRSTAIQVVESNNGGFFGRLKCFFFGCPQQTTTVIKGNDYTFPNDSGITLTMAVTENGSKIDSFEHFRLQGIRSLYGEDAQCRIKKRSCVGFFCSYQEFTATPTIVNGSSSYEDLTAQQWLSWCGNNNDGNYHNLSDFFFNLPFFGSDYKVMSNAQQTASSLVLDLKRIRLDTNSTSVTLRYKLMDVK